MGPGPIFFFPVFKSHSFSFLNKWGQAPFISKARYSVYWSLYRYNTVFSFIIL